ncbi:hypothetical protein EGW08_014877 [Elysia chlorotica]|uniref:Uncharacterized protein n=1 Tax=Elysia chlorotica TaxID=188477 RepID=A0A433T737_ELYCH|nr:hypothetical protein EGW08_014877 [Elysia chlorotica]
MFMIVLFQVHPKDPIYFISQWLYKYANNRTFFHNKAMHYQALGTTYSDYKRQRLLGRARMKMRSDELNQLQSSHLRYLSEEAVQSSMISDSFDQVKKTQRKLYFQEYVYTDEDVRKQGLQKRNELLFERFHTSDGSSSTQATSYKSSAFSSSLSSSKYSSSTRGTTTSGTSSSSTRKTTTSSGVTSTTISSGSAATSGGKQAHRHDRQRSAGNQYRKATVNHKDADRRRSLRDVQRRGSSRGVERRGSSRGVERRGLKDKERRRILRDDRRRSLRDEERRSSRTRASDKDRRRTDNQKSRGRRGDECSKDSQDSKETWSSHTSSKRNINKGGRSHGYGTNSRRLSKRLKKSKSIQDPSRHVSYHYYTGGPHAYSESTLQQDTEEDYGKKEAWLSMPSSSASFKRKSKRRKSPAGSSARESQHTLKSGTRSEKSDKEDESYREQDVEKRETHKDEIDKQNRGRRYKNQTDIKAPSAETDHGDDMQHVGDEVVGDEVVGDEVVGDEEEYDTERSDFSDRRESQDKFGRRIRSSEHMPDEREDEFPRHHTLKIDSSKLFQNLGDDEHHVTKTPSEGTILRKKSSRPSRISRRFTQVSARWFLSGSPPVITCFHPVLGNLLSPHRLRVAVESAGKFWGAAGHACQVLYDQEIYTVCEPHADDSLYRDRMAQWTGTTWVLDKQ